jgi:uncharacterized protein YndB with AHSA1/START domain
MQARKVRGMQTSIHWPERYAPGKTPVHVRNEIETSAPPEVVWAWLLRASRWPSWYPNSHNVRINQGLSADLALGAHFTWRTFGVGIRSTVVECVPCERIAWNAHGLGVDAYHAWLITPSGTGSHVLTEETQHGWVARLGSHVFPNRMSHFHQIWLERLASCAQSGPPPE